MNMTNVKVLIKPDETTLDIIAEICEECNISPDEPFAFSAIMTPDKDDGYYKLKINCIEPSSENPYTPESLVTSLMRGKEQANKVRYVQPPLEQWLTIFRPFLLKLVNRVHPRYQQLIPEREELLSLLYLCVIRLHRKGYYLHNTLIHNSFINELNMECRKLKGDTKTDSLDAPIGQDDDGKDVTLLDQLADTDSTNWARRCLTYTDDDYWGDMFEAVKARMLEDMSEFAFERILLQLRTGTVDRSTSYKLDKYRQIFNPDYVPRPNAKGKNRGGKKI